MADIPQHHIVYGTSKDYISGELVPDTDDERYRQKIARYLVEDKLYRKEDFAMRMKIDTLYAGQFVTSTIDMAVKLNDKFVMLLRYGPGSLVTRERPAVAAARVLLKDQQIPLAVVTNGEDAELIDTRTQKVIGTGLEAIPSRPDLLKLSDRLDYTALHDENKRDKELRILNAFDIEICCAGQPCALPGAKEG